MQTCAEHPMHWLALLLGFTGMELFSYCVHRFLFHGALWAIHRTHHLPRKGPFEANDLFSLSFSLLAAAGILVGASQGERSALLGASVGVTLYGVLYFLLHDLATHRRFWPFEPPLAWMIHLRQAHRRHHQTVSKEGQEPFGFLIGRGGQK
jgi:beta-carotene 3-hydroxylase